jgi:hypothetical protein
MNRRREERRERQKIYREENEKSRAELEKTPAFRIIASLLEEPASTVENAVQQTVDLCKPDETACCLAELAQRTPAEAQHKLVTFVHELQKVNIVDPNTGKPQTYPITENSTELLWSELPLFGVTWADESQSLGTFPSF